MLLLRSGLKMTEGLIRRRYALGVNLIIRLFGDLQAYIDDLPPIEVSEPERLILAQKAEIESLEQNIHNKDTDSSRFINSIINCSGASANWKRILNLKPLPFRQL